jgi:transposase
MGVNSIFTEELRSRQNRYFSSDIKMKIIRDLERNYTTVAEVCKVHQVSRTSIYRWIYKYSVMAKKQHKQVVEPKSDTQKIRALEERIKELERMVGQKQLLLEFKDKMIEIAEATYGVDIKKKVGSRLLSGTTSTGESTKGN